MFDFSTPVDRHGTYCTQWDYVEDRFGQPDLLPFTISDMDFETAPAVRQALETRMTHGVLGYSRWNHDDFKQAVCGWFARRYDSQMEPASLVYGPSVIYIVAQLITMWSAPGEGVLVHTPAYDAFASMIEANQRRMLRSPLQHTSDGYRIDWEQFEQQIARPECRILLLCSPHNPTGRVWRRDELQRMARLCHDYGVKVISDDIHMDMAYYPYIPWSQVAADDNWALVSSGSKSFNIPALTGAYAFIAGEESRARYLHQLKAAHGLSSPAILSVIAHMAAYNQGEAWLEALKQYLQKNLQYVADTLNQAFPQLDYQVPEGTYLAWIDLSPLNVDMDRLQQRLIEKHKVAIMRGDAYGPEGENCLRLNVGCPKEKLQAGVEALIKALSEE